VAAANAGGQVSINEFFPNGFPLLGAELVPSVQVALKALLFFRGQAPILFVPMPILLPFLGGHLVPALHSLFEPPSVFRGRFLPSPVNPIPGFAISCGEHPGRPAWMVLFPSPSRLPPKGGC
jgi:hypothetical protein